MENGPKTPLTSLEIVDSQDSSKKVVINGEGRLVIVDPVLELTPDMEVPEEDVSRKLLKQALGPKIIDPIDQFQKQIFRQLKAVIIRDPKNQLEVQELPDGFLAKVKISTHLYAAAHDKKPLDVKDAGRVGEGVRLVGMKDGRLSIYGGRFSYLFDGERIDSDYHRFQTVQAFMNESQQMEDVFEEDRCRLLEQMQDALEPDFSIKQVRDVQADSMELCIVAVLDGPGNVQIVVLQTSGSALTILGGSHSDFIGQDTQRLIYQHVQSPEEFLHFSEELEASLTKKGIILS